MKRCGKITSSAIGKLMVSGRREMTPSELEIAKKQGVKRKTVDVPFGDTAISYLYQVARERRLNKPCRPYPLLTWSGERIMKKTL